MSDEVLAIASVLGAKIDGNKELIGYDEAPEAGDGTLQRQHKTIENLLANLTGGTFHTADDVVPEEHTFSQLWEAVQNTVDITFDESNNIVMLSKVAGTSMTVSKLNPTTGALTEGATLTFPDSLDQTYGGILIEKCGNKYAVLYHKMSYNASGDLPVYAETTNKIYIFSQAFSYESTIDCSSLVTDGGVRGMGWDGTNLVLLIHTPKEFDDNQYGFADRFLKIDLTGTEVPDSEVMLTTGQTAVSAPVANRYTLKQKLAINSTDSEIYMPKILFSRVSSRIWAVNGAGILKRIFRFTDMLGGVVADNNKYNSINTVVESCIYASDYMYLLLVPESLSFPIIAKTRINF